jgi:hypothetical protein
VRFLRTCSPHNEMSAPNQFSCIIGSTETTWTVTAQTTSESFRLLQAPGLPTKPSLPSCYTVYACASISCSTVADTPAFHEACAIASIQTPDKERQTPHSISLLHARWLLSSIPTPYTHSWATSTNVLTQLFH